MDSLTSKRDASRFLIFLASSWELFDFSRVFLLNNDVHHVYDAYPDVFFGYIQSYQKMEPSVDGSFAFISQIGSFHFHSEGAGEETSGGRSGDQFAEGCHMFRSSFQCYMQRNGLQYIMFVYIYT